MRVRGKIAIVVAVLVGLSTVTSSALADSQTTTNAPYTCTTNPSVGTQVASFTVTASDTVDPATPGTTETYRFTVPFQQAQTPVAATYKGGNTYWRIPAGFSVTSVTTQQPPGGSPVTSSAQVQGDSIVVTSTANIPLDGQRYPTPDLVVTGTVTAAAQGAGISWLLPYRLVANVEVQGFGTIVATCTPDAPSTVVARTTVPLGPRPPVPANQNVALPQDTTKAITLSATDPDTPQGQLTYAIETQPTHGALTGTAPAVTYAPQAGYIGPDSFTFRVSDPDGNSAVGTVSINVFPGSVIDNTPPTITLTSPANGAVYTPGQVVNAAFSCADPTTGIKSCTGTVANGAAISTTVGVHTFVVNASDNKNNLARRTVSYRVVDTALVNSAVTSAPINCGSTQPLAPTSIPMTPAAPSQVGTGRAMTFRVTFGAQSVPALTTATNLRYVFAAPTNGTVTAATVVAGTGSANARPGATATVNAGAVTLTLPGPIGSATATAATPFTPPTLQVTITGGTTAGNQVQTRFQRFQAHHVVVAVDQDLDCPAGNSTTPNPVLTSTTIIDTTPPQVLIGTPGNGAVYDQGATLNANFGCADDRSLSTCTGPVANGAPISTSTAGIRSFVVSASDSAGNFAQSFVSYTVLPPTETFTARFPAGSEPLLDLAAAHFGTTRENLPRVAVSAFAYVDSVNPGLAQPTTPPSNSGPIVIGTTYPRSQVPAVIELASKWGMDPDSFHVLATMVLCYIASVQS
jgi:hypothetical protein